MIKIYSKWYIEKIVIILDPFAPNYGFFNNVWAVCYVVILPHALTMA